jgi:hypothetical protein
MILAGIGACIFSFLLGVAVHWFYSLMDGPWVKYPEGSGWSGNKK